jgi:transketolase
LKNKPEHNVGDLVEQTAADALYYLSYPEFQRILALDVPLVQRTAIFSDMCRLNALYMIARAGSGHIGSSLSSLDIVSWLLLVEMRDNDRYFSSKGHDAPGYYAALIGTGKLDDALLHKLRDINGLPGHPEITTPGIVTNTGSLGMGVSKAKGMVLAHRMAKRSGRVFVMTGDGELQEGQFWESLISAANLGLHEITVIIDHNKLQSDTFVKHVSDLGDLEAKLNAFGWCVARCNGNDIDALANTLARIAGDQRPKVIIADTVKGKGVSFMEHTSLDSDTGMYPYHSGAPDAEAYRLAAQEIMDRLQQRIGATGAPAFSFDTLERNTTTVPGESTQHLIAAYSSALLEQAEKHTNLVALDADLVLDTGLIAFRDQYPSRFVECGIAEQDMVSIAGGMALSGQLPIVHSFACFLSARPNEQIYNNATEKTKIIYVGSLAGVIPGGPGHSHQAVRDIAALNAIPEMSIVEPCCEQEVGMLLDWCINKAQGSSYIRLVSLPWEVPYQLPSSYQPALGQGVTLLEGKDAVVFTYGPIMLGEAIKAAEILSRDRGAGVKVVNLPWLNQVNKDWLASEIGNCQRVYCLDNHYQSGGQSDAILRALVGAGKASIQIERIGVAGIPPSGTNAQVLNACGLDAQGLVQRITQTW